MDEFYKTRMGQTFFCKTLPELVQQLERLSAVLERLAGDLEGQVKRAGEEPRAGA